MSKAIGARLKAIRKAKRPRVSRRCLSEQSGISSSTIRAIEEGERSLSLRNLLTLVRALDCDALLLLSAGEGLVSIPLNAPTSP